MCRGCFRHTNLWLIFVDWAKEKSDYRKMFGTRHPRRPTAETGSDALRSPTCVITRKTDRSGKETCCIFFIQKYYESFFFFSWNQPTKTETATPILILIWILLFRRFTIILCPRALLAEVNCFVFPSCFFSSIPLLWRKSRPKPFKIKITCFPPGGAGLRTPQMVRGSPSAVRQKCVCLAVKPSGTCTLF